MSKGLYTTNYKNKNNDLVIMIKSGLSDFNDQTQREQGAKILIPKQILSKLPIFLAQLKIENN